MVWVISFQISSRILSTLKWVRTIAVYCFVAFSILFTPTSLSRDCSLLSYNGGNNLHPLFYRANRHSYGILSDVLGTAAKRSKTSLSLAQEKPWKRLLLELKQGDLDFLVGVTHNTNLGDIFDFSVPISSINLKVYANRDYPFKFDQLSDLESLIGGKLLGMSLGDKVDKFAFENLVIEEKISLASLFKMLAFGRLDYVVMYETAGDQFLQKTNLHHSIVSLDKPLHVIDLHIAATRKSTCKASIKKVLNEIRLQKSAGAGEQNKKETEVNDR